MEMNSLLFIQFKKKQETKFWSMSSELAVYIIRKDKKVWAKHNFMFLRKNGCEYITAWDMK